MIRCFVCALVFSEAILISLVPCRSVFGGVLEFRLQPAEAGTPKVRVLRTPDRGLQPQALVDGKGALHLLYIKGNPEAGDLFYVRKAAGAARFSSPVKVNSQTGSAIAIGTIRGGRIALGKGGRVHVAWNGSQKALPKGPGEGTPMLYARMSDAGSEFEPQRNLMHTGEYLDGGGTVAADGKGNVYVAWHAKKITGPAGEDNRRVWVALSRDDGKTFSKESAAFDKSTGACGCCGMHAFTDKAGTTYMIYRSASKSIHRDMWLLCSSDQGKSFAGSRIHPWDIDACPMSSEAFAEGPAAVYAAWDTKGQVYFGPIDSAKAAVSEVVAAPGAGRGRKHPALAVNAKGEILLAWTEGTGWQRGGDLAWQVFDAKLRPTREHGRIAGAVPVWGLPSAVANADGTFTIFH
jgi:hypothetical protein